MGHGQSFVRKAFWYLHDIDNFEFTFPDDQQQNGNGSQNDDLTFGDSNAPDLDPLNRPCTNCGFGDCLWPEVCHQRTWAPSDLRLHPWVAPRPNRGTRDESGSTQLPRDGKQHPRWRHCRPGTDSSRQPIPPTRGDGRLALCPGCTTDGPADAGCGSRHRSSPDRNVRGSPQDTPNTYTNTLDNTDNSPAYPAPDSAERNAANALGRLNRASNAKDVVWPDEDAGANAGPMLLNGSDQLCDGLAASQHARDDADQTGFAKLVFPDGDYLIRHPKVILGRNMDVYRQYLNSKARKQAQTALQQYEQEPSRNSQQGDTAVPGSQSMSSQSLEGRPAPPSTFSEHGGVVSYQADTGDHDDDHRPRRRKRRSLAVSKSSSNASVDPSKIQSGASLDNDATLDSDIETERRSWTHLSVHPHQQDDIRLISKQHLVFRFNFQRSCWELQVVGNGAFVNEKYVAKYDVIELHHNDEILLTSLQIFFKLPDDRNSPGLSQGTFSKSDDESDVDSDRALDVLEWASPARRLSNVFEDASSDLDDPDGVDNAGKPKSKLKGKLKKPKVEPHGGPSTQIKKEKKPKAADKPLEPKKEDKASPPVQIDPDSSLANVPVDELPAKRKGPGRPPKNGFVSKRDQALVNKKQKEYEKRGEDPPPFADLVEMVRKESKARDQQKAMNNGDVAMGAVLPSIETGADGTTTKAATGSKPKATRKSTASVERQRVSPSNPRKRKHPSLSPIPPRESLTAEQLAKPTNTYLILLNSILEEHPEGEADLPELYARLKKKYPYFEYVAGSSGWQSSVRHNLINPRFKSNGKSGKGHIWRINYDESIEQAMKKQKQNQQAKQPTMQQPAQQRQAGNGNQPSQMNGHPQFNANQAAYSSPYGQPGQHSQAGPSNASSQAPNDQSTPKPKTKWDVVLQQFVDLQAQYFNNFTNATEEERNKRDDFYAASMGKLSNGFGNLEHPKPDAVEGAIAASGQLPVPTDDLDEQMQLQLKDIFTGGLLIDAAREKAEIAQREKEKERAATQATNSNETTAAAASAAPTGLNGDVPTVQSAGNAPLSRADMIPPAQPQDVSNLGLPFPQIGDPTRPADMTMPTPTPAAHTAPHLAEHGSVEIGDGSAEGFKQSIDESMPDAETSQERSSAA